MGDVDVDGARFDAARGDAPDAGEQFVAADGLAFAALEVAEQI